MALYLSLGAIGFSMLLYNISRPAEGGEQTALAKWLDDYITSSRPTWEERNTLRTNIKEQAAADRHTFLTVEKPKAFDYRMPELFNSGCPHNVPAGHYVNLDRVVEHYRKLHLDDEDRKAKKLAQARKDG